MKNQLTQKRRLLITVVITLVLGAHIGWDYFHGGIPTHYILHSKDMPGIPNWWGALVLPVFTYFLLFRISKRLNEPDKK
jgi:TRAP-type C4-dicarboxylate transport system permease small subunit